MSTLVFVVATHFIDLEDGIIAQIEKLMGALKTVNIYRKILELSIV